MMIIRCSCYIQGGRVSGRTTCLPVIVVIIVIIIVIEIIGGIVGVIETKT